MQETLLHHAYQCVRASNINTYVYAAYESIVLDYVGVRGITNYGLDVLNNDESGTITAVYVYGSYDGINYYKTEDGLYTVPIGPGELKHMEFGLVTGFIRVTVQTDADIKISVCLHGNIT